MKLFKGWLDPDLPRGGAATIGNFDGIHRGHAEILRRVAAEARHEGIPGLLLTFDPHPARILHPDTAPALIATRDQRAEWISPFGLDAVWEIPFTPEVARWEPEAFIREVLADRLTVRHLTLGAGFRFGHRRRGDIALLEREGRRRGFRVEVAPPFLYDGEPISSSRIRSAVRVGDMEAAAAMLGRPFELSGVVVPGARRGSRLGFPTVNLRTDNELSPADGIYAAQVRLNEGGWRPAAASIGVNPTFGGGARTMEAFILDFDGDAYGTRLRLRLPLKLRDQEAFPSPEALRAAIAADVEAVRAFFAGVRPEDPSAP